MDMGPLTEFLNAPKDIWNVIGAVFLLVPGVIAYLIMRQRFGADIERLRAQGAMEEAEAKSEAWRRIAQIIGIIDFVMLPAYGFFVLGKVLRETFG